MKPFGLITALATPMYEDGTVKLEELSRQVERMVASGVHGVFCLGTNGEFYVLSEQEKENIIKVTVRSADHRLPVYAGVGCATTRETVMLAEKAQRLKADALSVITPYFGQVSQEALFEHYRSVAVSTDLPILLYNIPARTGNEILPKTLERLAAIPNIAGIKDSSGNFDTILKFLEVTGRTFPVLSGNDSLILYTLMAGGTGGVSGCANLYPRKMAAIYDLFIGGHTEEAMKIQDGIRPVRNCLSLGNPNSVVKRLANLLGQPLGPARLPFSVPDEYDVKLLEVINQYNGWD